MLRIGLKIALLGFGVMLMGLIALLAFIGQRNADQADDLLAYSTSENGQAIVFAYDIARDITVPVLNEPSAANIQLSWAPDGQTFIAALISGNGHSRLMELDRFGNPGRQIYPAVAETTPFFSGFMRYDASRLTFAAVPGNNPIFNVVHVNTGDLSAVWHPLSRAADIRGFCLTPEGSIRYIRLDRRNLELYELRGTGMNARAELLQSWSDEFAMTRLAQFIDAGCNQFMLPLSKADALNLEVYLFDVNRPDFVNISNRPLHNDSNIAVSSDGQRIAYTSVNGSGYYIVVSSLDGAEQRIVHENDALIASIKWSEDDSRLAVVYQHNTTYGARLCIITLKNDDVTCSINARQIVDVAWRAGGS